jgi:hypothetical protein
MYKREAGTFTLCILPYERVVIEARSIRNVCDEKEFLSRRFFLRILSRSATAGEFKGLKNACFPFSNAVAYNPRFITH